MGLVLILLLLGGAAYAVMLYNSLVRMRNLKEEAWSGIDVQLKRRHDLIPAIVSTVEGYSEHERDTLAELTTLRTQAQQQTRVAEIGETEKSISKDIKQIFALAEAYPDLKANESFLELQTTLTEVEDDIQFARRYYNGTVRDYKTKMQMFPSNIIANMASFEDADFFELEFATERKNPELDL